MTPQSVVGEKRSPSPGVFIERFLIRSHVGSFGESSSPAAPGREKGDAARRATIAETRGEFMRGDATSPLRSARAERGSSSSLSTTTESATFSTGAAAATGASSSSAASSAAAYPAKARVRRASSVPTATQSEVPFLKKPTASDSSKKRSRDDGRASKDSPASRSTAFAAANLRLVDAVVVCRAISEDGSSAASISSYVAVASTHDFAAVWTAVCTCTCTASWTAWAIAVDGRERMAAQFGGRRCVADRHRLHHRCEGDDGRAAERCGGGGRRGDAWLEVTAGAVVTSASEFGARAATSRRGGGPSTHGEAHADGRGPGGDGAATRPSTSQARRPSSATSTRAASWQERVVGTFGSGSVNVGGGWPRAAQLSCQGRGRARRHRGRRRWRRAPRCRGLAAEAAAGGGAAVEL